MQQNPSTNTPPSSSGGGGGGGEKMASTTVAIPPASEKATVTQPHTFDTKGITDIESLPASSSLDRRRQDEKKMYTTAAGTMVSSSQPGDEEDSDLDTLLMESPIVTGNNGRRHHVTSSLRFGTTRSGYSDSGIFETSSPGSTATHSLARSTTSSKKKPSVRPVVRDMFSEYTASTPLPERAVKRAKTVLSTASISLRPAVDASISTDDFYFPLDASVLLPTERTTPLVMSRATISTPTRTPYPTTDVDTQRIDQQVQTESKPPKAKRKSVTKRILLFRSSHHPAKASTQPVASHTTSAPSDQLRAERTTDLSTSGVPALTGVILVNPSAAATGLSTIAPAAVMEVRSSAETALPEGGIDRNVRAPQEEKVSVLEGTQRAAAISESLSDDESADSLEASWYQPHLRHSAKVKRFHKKVRRNLKDGDESHRTDEEREFEAPKHDRSESSVLN